MPNAAEVLSERPEVDEVIPGTAPERGEKPDLGNVVDINTGKARDVIDRLTARQDLEDTEKTSQIRGSLLRGVTDRAHATVTAEREDAEAIEKFPTTARAERIANTAQRQEKSTKKSQRKSAIRDFLDSFRVNRPK